MLYFFFKKFLFYSLFILLIFVMAGSGSASNAYPSLDVRPVPSNHLEKQLECVQVFDDLCLLPLLVLVSPWIKVTMRAVCFFNAVWDIFAQVARS
jgi:hypothetical protein